MFQPLIFQVFFSTSLPSFEVSKFFGWSLGRAWQHWFGHSGSGRTSGGLSCDLSGEFTSKGEAEHWWTIWTLEALEVFWFHQKIEWDPTNGPLSKLLELLDTQVFLVSVQWVLLEISWIHGNLRVPIPCSPPFFGGWYISKARPCFGMGVVI